MSKKSRKKDNKSPIAAEAAEAVDPTEIGAAAAEPLAEPIESAETLVEIQEIDGLTVIEVEADAIEFPEEDAESSGEGFSELPEAVTEEALSGDVPAGEVPRLSHVIEAILFASQKAVTAKELAAHLKSAATAEPAGVASAFARIKESGIQEALVELKAEVAASGRAYQVRETSTGWLLTSAAGFAPWLRALYPEAKPTRLSPSALETLAIIAYRQPLARADMEAVRGVSVDGVMQTLLDRGLVKISGRAEVAGRPLLYSTTQYFLDHFGLRNLDELPNAAELRHIPLPKATPDPESATPADEGDPLLELPGVNAEPSLETGEVLEETEVTEILEVGESVVFEEILFDPEPQPGQNENPDSESQGENEDDAAAGDAESVGQTDSPEADSGHPQS